MEDNTMTTGHLEVADLVRAKTFWRSYLRGALSPTFLQLPTAKQLLASNHQSKRDHLAHYVVVSRQKGSEITVSTIIRSAWAIVAARNSEADEIVFGIRSTPVHPNAQIAASNGNTSPAVPVRFQIDKRQPVMDWLLNVQQQIAAVIKFQHVGIENIRRLDPHIEAVSEFQHILIIEQDHQLPHSNIRTDDSSFTESKSAVRENFHDYPLILECNLDHGKINLHASFDRSLIKPPQMKHLLHQFEKVMHQLNADQGDNRTLADIDLFTDHDKSLVKQWNDQAPEVVERCIHEIIQEQVKVRPDAPAVFARDGNLSYGELDDLSNRLAWYLKSLGVGPEVLVPHCFHKSVWTVVTLLGVLKAGGACVALDPTYPLWRLESIVGDAEAVLVLASPENVQLCEKLAPQVVGIDAQLLQSLPAAPPGHACLSVSSRNTAFVVFTSGSTGIPKGIILEHGSITSSAMANGEKGHIGPGKRVLQFSNYSFDVSLGEMFTTLMRGGCVCVPSEFDRLNNLAGVINDMEVNWAFMPPSLANLLHPHEVPTLKLLRLGAEAASPEHIRKWAEYLELIISYGPAETSVHCAATPPVTLDSSPTNIGNAVGCRLWIVEPSDHNRLAPVGCVGELLVQGRTVARGYLNDPAKSEAAFIEMPAWFAGLGQDKTNNSRFYKTGDLARYNMDGTISFVGRKDSQIKHHGQRVELGEIEHHLQTDERVRHALVVQPKSGPFEDRLVALLSFHEFRNSDVSTTMGMTTISEIRNERTIQHSSEIREHLSRKVPTYMVPGLWLTLNNIPVNSSFKMDRRKTTKWIEELDEETCRRMDEAEVGAAAKEYTHYTENELLLKRAVSHTLSLPQARVVLDSSFMRLGGDSLAAMQLVVYCATQGLSISVQAILESRTISEIALAANTTSNDSKVFDEEECGERRFALLSYPPVDNLIGEEFLRSLGLQSIEDIEDVYPSSPMQMGVLLGQLKSSNSYKLESNFEIVPRVAGKPVDANLVHKAWQKLVDRHAILRTVFVETTQEDSLYCQLVLKRSVARVSRHTSVDEASFATIGADSKIDFRGTEPAVHLCICETVDGRVLCKLKINHALFDGKSRQIIFRELQCAYDGKLLETLGPQYRDYVSYIQKGPGDLSKTYWLEHLRDVQPCFLPNFGEEILSPKERLPFTSSISLEQLSELQQYSQNSGLTVASLLQTVWAFVLQSYTGSERVCFGVLTSGRHAGSGQFSNAVGMFANLLICNLNLPQSTTIVHVVEEFQQDFAGSIAHHHQSLADLQHELGSSGRGLFNTIVSVQMEPSRISSPSTSVYCQMIGSGGTTEYDFSVSIRIRDTVISVDLDCWNDKVSKAQADAILGTYNSILYIMLRNAEAVVADLDIISKKTLAVIAAGPKNQLLESSNVPLRSKILPSTAMERRLESLWQDILIVNDGSKKKVGEEESKQETFADSNSLRPDNKDFEGLEPVADLKRIKQWNKELPITSNLTVHSAFKLQVSEHPDSPAICSWDGNLSYSELDDLSNRFASYLCHLGVRPEVLVAICFDKSKWAVVAMLAVLKAGGAFVPLTFQAPTAREKQILRDTKTTVLITSPSKFASDFESVVHTVVRLTTEFDQELQGIVRASTDRHWEEHDDGIPNRDAALIIFTSGSTGTPKGIVQEHAALVTSLIQIGKVMGLDQSSRVLQFSSYTFDLSFCDHFSTLITGGCVCIPSSYQLKNSLAESIRAMKVNVCHLTPTASKLIHPSEVQLQTLVLGGEPVTKNELRVWADNVHLIQAYGPSEAAIFCIGHTSPLKTNSQPNNIGKGISVSVWITDPENHNRLAPIGAIGEILIEGPVLARGYLNNDELTRYSFIEDPLWSVETTPGQRIRRFYKTGDLGSYASDGSIHIVGRKDTQVKIRGQRVELGEIEYQLQQRLGGIEVVAEVVNPAYSNASQKMIVAFLRVGVEEAVEISEPTAATDASIVARDMGSRRRIKELTTGLLRQLGQVLPFYMLPSAFVPTNRMPKTTSGKTDRKILRETATKMSAQELAGFVEDGGSNEESIYSSGYSPTSIFADDNFFNIGGDSISAMRLVSAARRNGILLSVEDVFKHPALRDMASVARIINGKDSIINDIQTFSMAGTQDELKSHVDQAAKQCSVVADMIEDIFPCTPLQSGLMALSVKEPGTYITRAVYKLPELVDADRFKAAWMESSDRHAILRTRIIYTTSHGFMQVVLKPEAFNSWETAESLDLDSYLSENRSSKQMTPGLPLTVLTITQDRHFVWTAHHSTYDGWSMERLLEHVEMAYNSIHISPQQSDFTAFVKFLQDSDVEKTKDFWRSQLAGAIAPSYPTSPTLQYQPLADSSITRAFPVSTKIGTGITAATILRAAWGLTMAKYENVSNIVFGTVLNGRNASVAGIENIMGPTIATVPVRIQIDTTRSLSQFLRAVQEQAVGMIPYQHFGLQNISSLGPDQEQACKFKILLVVQQKAPQTRIAPGQRLGLEKINIRSATFLTYPITMECVLEDGTATINASYDSRAIGSKQMQRMMNHFEHTILQLITANRASSIHDLSSISSADIQDIESWHCDLPLISTETLDSLFRQQVQKQPASQAVCSHDGVLTYAELDDISNRIAGHLVERSEIGVEDTVALCSEKSVWAIASILGILKAGGAYVPIAFQEPTDRERTILQSAKAKVIIASPVHAESFRALGLNVVSLTRSFIQGLHPSPGSFHVDLRKSSNAALVIFTSGSTGTPKGVVQEHSSLVTSLLEIGQRMGLNSQSRALQFAAYTFDLSFCDIMSTLITGGCICSISEEDRTNNLAGFINRFEVNVAHLTPTVSRLLIPSTVPGLKTLVLGGEPLTRAEVTTWADQVHLIQGYGPTEAGVCCVLSQLNIDSHPSNIGKSFSSWMWITLQDNHDQLAPIGAIGEILLEGPILSRGYLGNEALTAASFVENPAFARNNDHSQDKMPPRRFYKTGDLARYNTDGSIQIIGRKDSQIKLRGQRIELGEVEYQVKKLLPADMDVVVEVLSPAQGSLAPTMIAFISIAQRVEKFSLLAPDFPNVLNPSHKSASDEHVA